MGADGYLRMLGALNAIDLDDTAREQFLLIYMANLHDTRVVEDGPQLHAVK